MILAFVFNIKHIAKSQSWSLLSMSMSTSSALLFICCWCCCFLAIAIIHAPTSLLCNCCACYTRAPAHSHTTHICTQIHKVVSWRSVYFFHTLHGNSIFQLLVYLLFINDERVSNVLQVFSFFLRYFFSFVVCFFM